MSATTKMQQAARKVKTNLALPTTATWETGKSLTVRGDSCIFKTLRGTNRVFSALIGEILYTLFLET